MRPGALSFLCHHIDAPLGWVVMKQMTDAELKRFLTTGTRTGKLAWVAQTGAPHVAPVWFTLDGDDVIFNTHRDTGKAKAMAREGRACLLVDQEEPPYAFVKVDGTVTFEDDLDRVRSVATEIGGRYMGADRATEFGERNGTAGELVVRLTPTKITALDDVAGY